MAPVATRQSRLQGSQRGCEPAPNPQLVMVSDSVDLWGEGVNSFATDSPNAVPG